nr:hypothetical protein Q903MT_gene6206 [Picea sitchensis]
MMMLAGRSGQRGLISLPMRAVPTDTMITQWMMMTR